MNSLRNDVMIDREWLTAKVADPCLVRRCLGRLDANGYEYRVVFDALQLRILVRRVDLDEVLVLFADLSSGFIQLRGARQGDHGTHVRLLTAIPLGAMLGSILSALLAIPVQSGTTISAICACLAAFIAANCLPTFPLSRRIFANAERADCREPKRLIGARSDAPDVADA